MKKSSMMKKKVFGFMKMKMSKVMAKKKVFKSMMMAKLRKKGVRPPPMALRKPKPSMKMAMARAMGMKKMKAMTRAKKKTPKPTERCPDANPPKASDVLVLTLEKGPYELMCGVEKCGVLKDVEFRENKEWSHSR